MHRGSHDKHSFIHEVHVRAVHFPHFQQLIPCFMGTAEALEVLCLQPTGLAGVVEHFALFLESHSTNEARGCSV